MTESFGETTRESDSEIRSQTSPSRLTGQIGRYEISELLGEGAYGQVYLAFDPQLDRQVALKVPNRKYFDKDNRIETFLTEARNAASLKHPGLVTVYDIQVEQGQPYIVQEFIAGGDLTKWMALPGRTDRLICQLLLEISDSVGFAHQHGVIHRDLKPANILVDTQGHTHVTDFGLAVHENVLRSRKGEITGSPAYMSPEQVRGETHRLDGRTDIWSLGVILYEMLCGKRPFAGKNRFELYDNILDSDPKPPRQHNPSISKELERICNKCLAKYPAERYHSAADLCDDLKHWLKTCDLRPLGPQAYIGGQSSAPTDTASSSDPSVGVVPRGLRSFDHLDADFFLSLLPGPRGRDGLPESIRFWRSRLEETHDGETFSVGLMYGPSGCGKTSLMKAGLLPLLSSRVLPLYIEATPHDTETRLLNALGRHLPKTSNDDSLPATLRRLREGFDSGRKVLLVIDQFEQWLHTHRGQETTPLTQALRQCDGARIQCVLMVRDDFWMAVTRFM